MFRNYASPETGMMDLKRFKKLLNDTGLFPSKLSLNDLAIIFNQAKSQKELGLTSATILQSLFLIAQMLKTQPYNGFTDT